MSEPPQTPEVYRFPTMVDGYGTAAGLGVGAVADFAIWYASVAHNNAVSTFSSASNGSPSVPVQLSQRLEHLQQTVYSFEDGLTNLQTAESEVPLRDAVIIKRVEKSLRHSLKTDQRKLNQTEQQQKTYIAKHEKPVAQTTASPARPHHSHALQKAELYGGIPAVTTILGVVATASWRYARMRWQRRSIVRDFNRSMDEDFETATHTDD